MCAVDNGCAYMLCEYVIRVKRLNSDLTHAELTRAHMCVILVALSSMHHDQLLATIDIICNQLLFMASYRASK